MSFLPKNKLAPGDVVVIIGPTFNDNGCEVLDFKEHIGQYAIVRKARNDRFVSVYVMSHTRNEKIVSWMYPRKHVALVGNSKELALLPKKVICRMKIGDGDTFKSVTAG